MGKLSGNHNLLIKTVLLLALAELVFVYFFIQNIQNKKISTSEPIGVNSSYLSTQSEKDPYLTYHLTAPAGYFATSQSMFVPYKSQGGGGYADMILTKGYQINSPSTNAESQKPFDDLYGKGNSCILVYKDPAESIAQIDTPDKSINGVTVESSTETKINGIKTLIRNVSLQLRVDKSVSVYEAIMLFPKDVRYRFTTCNRNNKTDLMKVLESFKVRGE